MVVALTGAGAVVLLAGAVRGFRAVVKSRRRHLFGRPVHRVPTDRRVVALTLDDGPYPEHCQEILDILRSRRVPATFFLVGRDAAAHPELTAAIRAAGHELANHSWSHRRMLFMRGATIAGEIQRTDDVLARAGQPGPPLFRPPNCAKLFGLPYHLHRAGRPMITWDVEPETEPGPTGDAEVIVERALSSARPGSILLLHPMDQVNTATRAALPGIVDGLLARGFTLVTVSELLRERVQAPSGRA